MTFVDFIMYELLDQHRELDKALCAKYTKLMEFLDRFEKLPKIEAYMKSGRYVVQQVSNRARKVFYPADTSLSLSGS